MSIEEKKLLTDIKISLSSIDEHLQHTRDFSVYLKNKTMRRAVERKLEIIGEAMRKLLALNPDISISYARIIVDLRNKVIHAYDNVNNTIIWKIIMKDLPVLEKEIDYLLAGETF